jgi:hypothetical protein
MLEEKFTILTEKKEHQGKHDKEIKFIETHPLSVKELLECLFLSKT